MSLKAIGFDLGETLIYYEKVPGGSFKEHFRSALLEVMSGIGIDPQDSLLDIGEHILSLNNTRSYPREHEVKDDDIFKEILKAWQADSQFLSIAIELFFSYFREEVKVYDGVRDTLQKLKDKGYRIGILTDVPYGMNKQFVLRDLAPLHDYIDVVVTSVEVGFRKPRPEGYLELAARLECPPEEMLYVGNEQKDILGAARAGMQAILIDRENRNTDWGQETTITHFSALLAERL